MSTQQEQPGRLGPTNAQIMAWCRDLRRVSEDAAKVIEKGVLIGYRRAMLDSECDELREALDALAPRVARGLDTQAHREHVAQELADVLVVAFGTADLLGIDLEAAFDAVMTANEAKLPECPECYGPGAVREVDLRGMSELQAYLAIQDAQAAANPTCSYCHGTGKGKPIKRDDGKVMKPEDWQPPDMSGAIR